MKPPRVAVCIITLARPRGLERLLLALDQLVFEPQATPDVRILVVENDESGRARKVCREVRDRVRWPISFGVEPSRGIPHARNTAIALARREADFLAFIDDDEVPEPSWLAELLRVQATYLADVVTGPVVARFERAPPGWALKGGVYANKRFPTGTRRPYAATGNVLFRTRLFEENERPFDARLALGGGSDVHLTTRLERAGCRLVWADEAVAWHVLPESRVRLRWLMQRWFRTGQTATFILFDLDPWPRALYLTLRRSLSLAGRGFAELLAAAAARRPPARALLLVCTGIGRITGLLGPRYEEYRTIHGD